MKKLSLDKTWSECLRMWEWIAGQVKKIKGFNRLYEQDKLGKMKLLKAQWLKKNKYTAKNDCFFCEWDERCCDDCPAVAIDENFRCTDDKYCWFEKPITFNSKLIELNKIRLSKKKKTKKRKK